MSRRSGRSTDLPPPTRVDGQTDRLHGVGVRDPFRWLEGDNRDPDRRGQVTPEVAAWTDAQNAYTRQRLDGLPGRTDLERRLRELIEVGSVGLPTVRGDRYFHGRREGGEDQPTVYWRQGHDGADQVLVDPRRIDESGLTAIEWFSPSPDGRQLAYGTYRQGDENTTLRLLDVDSGVVQALEIPNKTQPPTWLPDCSGFVYQNLKDPADPYSGRVRFHRLGSDPSQDAVLFRQFSKQEDEKLATTWGPFGALSRDGRWLVLGYWTGTASNDLWLVDFQQFLDTGTVKRIPVTTGETGLAFGTVHDDTLYLRTTEGAPRGRLVAVEARSPERARWQEIVPERDDAAIELVSIGRGRIAVTYLRHAANVVEVFDVEGRPFGTLAQPGIGSVAVATEPDRTEAFVEFSSFNAPATIFRVDLSQPAARGDVWAQRDVPVDPSSVAVRQVRYPSKDGTSISMFLVHRRGLEKSGDWPTLLTGYGGFNISMTPAFSPTLFQWFEAGGLYALPNLRGGGEYGDAWHEAGMLERKQDVFDDFLAAAEWLIAEGYTDPRHLAIAGGSNGGLLTGAAITQRPDLFRAAVVAVPLLDMLRYQEFLMARYWVPEYGSAEKADQFEYLLKYSPYHRVSPGTAYPAVFLTAGEHDSRVHAMHARKMTAALQAATSADPAERPVLLRVDRDAGHGQGKPLSLQLRDTVDQRIFLMWQLGMLPQPGPNDDSRRFEFDSD